MNKTILILQQEYLKRVKKKSFIILTLLVPILFVGMFALIIALSVHDDKQERTIAVYDESSLFLGELDQEGYTKYHFIPKTEYDRLKSEIKGSEFYALLYIPENIYSNNSAQLISEKQVPIELSEQISRKLSRFIENSKRQKIIEEIGIDDLEERLAGTRTSIKLNTLKVTETGEAKKSSSGVAFIASYAMGFIIYFFVFMYGAMVMRSVMEEKKNRIVEVIISSVKPFQLMSGKIIGTALVGLTQVAIWVLLSCWNSGCPKFFHTRIGAANESEPYGKPPGNGPQHAANGQPKPGNRSTGTYREPEHSAHSVCFCFLLFGRLLHVQFAAWGSWCCC
jgi:ABC-2 type transport system permease protein